MEATHIQTHERYHMTPVGPVPTTFPYMEELLREAFIGYRDEMVETKVKTGTVKAKLETGGEVEIVEKPVFEQGQKPFRTWYIIHDAERVSITRKNTTGRSVKVETEQKLAANGHAKFCMILDYIEHVTGERRFAETLAIALGKQSVFETSKGAHIDLGETVAAMKKMDWRTLNNSLAQYGVRGYVHRGGTAVDLLPNL